MANEGYVFPNGIPRIRRRPPATRREYLEQQLEDHPLTGKMQRVKTLTREEKGRAAIDVMTGDFVREAKQDGQALPDVDKIHRAVVDIATSTEAKHGK